MPSSSAPAVAHPLPPSSSTSIRPPPELPLGSAAPDAPLPPGAYGSVFLRFLRFLSSDRARMASALAPDMYLRGGRERCQLGRRGRRGGVGRRAHLAARYSCMDDMAGVGRPSGFVACAEFGARGSELGPHREQARGAGKAGRGPGERDAGCWEAAGGTPASVPLWAVGRAVCSTP